MLIKFSKQIGNSLAKIINTKWIPDPAKYLRWSFFRKSSLGLEANSESCQTSKMELLAKMVKNEMPFTMFVKTYIMDVREGSEYASELASKVMDASFLNQFE